MTNPLLLPSALPYELPDFANIKPEHYREALDAGFAQQEDEIAAIVGNPEPATFENTILALEKSGSILRTAGNVFFNICSADSTDELLAMETEYAPRMSAHSDAITLNPQLFERVAAVYAARDQLDPEDAYLVERIYTQMKLEGAELDPAGKQRLSELNSRLSTLRSEFGNRLLADTNDSAVVFDSAEELTGLSESELSACQAAAEARGLSGKYLVTLVLPTEQPVLSSLTRRDARRRVMEASLARGNRGNEHDTNELVLEMVRLRAERARLLGFPSHAAYSVADQTAQTPEAIEERIYPLAAPAARNAQAEAAALQDYINKEAEANGTEPFQLEAWDWQYYADKVKEEQYSVDTAALKPYFEVDSVLRDGVFWAAEQLYGVTFHERKDLVGYHPDVRVFEVKDSDGTGLGLFLFDVYTRDSKRGGAWMNNLVDQSTVLGQKPVICNNLNVPKPSSGPTFLTLDEVSTMFHEFGHALHGMFANTRYVSLSGTAVSRDFVEFPSQVNEMWQMWPEVLANYARHHETGEPMDPEVVERLQASASYGEGFATSSYLASALLDQEWHKITPETEISSVAEFEQAALAKIGLDDPRVPPRYKTTYFNHTFGGGYDAGYYSYIWSEVLDADTVAWFKEHGGLTRANGDHFRSELLSRGRSRDPLESYRRFRGRDAEIEPLLERRGLL